MATLQGNGIDLWYEERGDGIPVLWLQGLGADHTAWAPQLGRFAPRYHCLAPDNRGAGQTAPAGALDLASMAADTLALLDACAPASPAHVVGLSMGASIAQELALLAPTRLRSLVLVSASAAIEPRIAALLEAWRAIYPLVGPGIFQRQANCWLFSWRFFERPGAADNVVAYAERHGPPPAWFTAQVDAALRHDTRARLPSLRLPVLVINGADDVMVPPRLGRDLAAHIPGARFLEIPEAGHSVNLEQQRPFNDAIQTFFSAHEG